MNHRERGNISEADLGVGYAIDDEEDENIEGVEFDDSVISDVAVDKEDDKYFSHDTDDLLEPILDEEIFDDDNGVLESIAPGQGVGEGVGDSRKISRFDKDVVFMEKSYDVKDTFDHGEDILKQGSERRKFESLKENVGDASTIQELCSVLRQVDYIKGSKQDFSSSSVISLIEEADNFLTGNIDKIISGVINQGAAEFRDLLGEKVNKITRGGDLELRIKVKELMKERMKNIFEKNRSALVKKAVLESTSLEQLYGVIKQFKSVNQKGGGTLPPEVVIEYIRMVVRYIDSRMDDSKWLSDNIRINQDIDKLIKAHNIPGDSGIDVKVAILLAEIIKEARRKKTTPLKEEKETVGSRLKRGFFKLIGR